MSAQHKPCWMQAPGKAKRGIRAKTKGTTSNIARNRAEKGLRKKLNALKKANMELIPEPEFRDVCYDIVRELKGDGTELRFQRSALAALRESAESHLVMLFELAAMRSGGATVQHIELVEDSMDCS